MSSVYLALAEDFVGADSGTTVAGNMYLIGVGGQSNWRNYGMGAYFVLATRLTKDGADVAWNTAITWANSNNGRHNQVALNYITAAADALDIAIGGVSSNGCYTAANNAGELNANSKWIVAGNVKSMFGCNVIAADGYVLHGFNVMYRFGNELILAKHGTATSVKP